ncbi:MAG: helix-turn-helix domain-containing protein [Lachnospira sp.]
MVWKKDKLKATQPFFVLDADTFIQEVYLRQGISHFYSFKMSEKKELKTVPDGCIDLVFEYKENGVNAYAAGTPQKCEGVLWDAGEYFGVRFLPGFLPAGLNVVLRDLIGKRILLEDIFVDKESKLIVKMFEQTDFYQRIRVFLEEYTKIEKKREKPYGKTELVVAVKDMVYESDGTIKVSELAEMTGYTARYINKVFIEQMGFSPKVFCKIIQFQRSLEFLNYGAPDKMTEAAVNLGYYDQSQFIRDFKMYCGITPKQYLKLIQSARYVDKVENSESLKEEEYI